MVTPYIHFVDGGGVTGVRLCCSHILKPVGRKGRDTLFEEDKQGRASQLPELKV